MEDFVDFSLIVNYTIGGIDLTLAKLKDLSVKMAPKTHGRKTKNWSTTPICILDDRFHCSLMLCLDIEGECREKREKRGISYK